VLIAWLATQALASGPVAHTAAPAPVQSAVHLRADVFGARMDTPVQVPAVQARGDALSVLDANARALQDVAIWVELSARAVDLDDYGRFRLLVAAVDALPVRTGGRASTRVTVSDALRSGRWTDQDRLLAIGGGLRAMGVAAAPFHAPDGRLLLGVSCDDRDLNVDAIEHDWRLVRNGQRQHVRVRWVLWDGQRALGTVGGATGVKPLDRALPHGRALSLATPRAPDFTYSRTIRQTRQVQGQPVSFVRHPDAAAWLALSPELRLPAGLDAAREHVRRTGLDRQARHHLRGLTSEVDRMDALIRLVQASFVYEPGPVRTLPELLERGRGDCDQLSLLLAALLLELGYSRDDLLVVSWPDHLGLAVRPRSGPGPSGATAVQLDTGRYVLVDVTHYMWNGSRLVSRWGRTSPEHGTQVTVRRLR